MRARRRPAGIGSGGTQIGEVGAPARRFGVPLHRGVTAAEFLHRDAGVATPTTDLGQTVVQVAFPVATAGLGDRGGALRVVVETRCLGPGSGTRPAVTVLVVIVVVCAVEEQQDRKSVV